MTITLLGRTHLRERKVAVAAVEVVEIDISDSSPARQEQHGQKQQETDEIEETGPVSHWMHMLEQEAHFPDLGLGQLQVK